MRDSPSYKTLAEHQRVFDQIWWQLPERQNRTSSSWWFFILFPEEEQGYGPRQLMFSIAARVGERIRVNDVWLPGMDLNRPIENGVDQFDAISVGWYGDGQQVPEDIVTQPAKTTLSREGSLVAWADREDGTKRGGEIRASPNRPLGLDAHFVGDKGEVRFEAWGDLDCPVTSPAETINVDIVAGGAHLVTWRRMQFKGVFDLPGGRETLEGLCCFHRACLNIPLFPWKWIWALFPDGTAFSAFVPYLGPQLVRNGDGFFTSNALEQATIPIRQSGLWDWGTSDQLVRFDTARVTPLVDAGPQPHFAVHARNQQGDSVKFVASSYGHARNYIDRPVLGEQIETHWSYNEYLFRMEELQGRIGDTVVSKETMGQGFGTLEYTWGVGL
jgi:hypothetical protein